MSSAYEIVMENRREIVERLISQMEKGYAQTRAAWNSVHTGRPYNPVSNAVYKGGNRLRLMIAAQEQAFSDPRWLTFKQASEQNYRIMSGAKGVLLEKWIFYKDVPKLDEARKPVIDTDGKPVMERIIYDKPIVNYFRVFNGSQIIGLPELERTEVSEDAYSQMADTFERSSMCPISYEMQDRAYYSSKEDKIHLPPKESFKNNETRLSVLLHEMAHSTGHETRLNRPIGNVFGSEAYAKEELNAELSSVFLENELCISMEPDSEMLKDHANYVKSWLSVLKENPNELFVACATAESITEYLMEYYGKELEKSMDEMKINQLTLEERYTEAMKIAGYESISVDSDELATIAFRNTETGHTLRYDGWQLVGAELEKMPVSDEAFEKLIHPEGRMEYYLKFPNTVVPLEPPVIEKYKSFEDACKAYQEAGFVNGKTLGFSVQGEKPVDLVWYSSRSMMNDLYRLSQPPMSYASDLTVNELDELGKSARQMLTSLQKENAYIQLANAVTDVEMKMVSVIEHGDSGRVNEVAGRFVSERRPQDYLDITVSDGGGAYDPAHESPDDNKELKIKVVHANEVIDCKFISVKMSRIMENGMQEFANQGEGVANWLRESITKLDTDFMPYGQSSFTFYSTFGMMSLENHYEKLENAGYERFPSDAEYQKGEEEQLHLEQLSKSEMEQFIEEHNEFLNDLAEKGAHQTLVVNAFGGPGAGKSTACFHVVEALKKQGYVTEYVSEYAKDLVWDENFELLDGSEEHQFEILKEQLHRIDRLYGKVDFIVTDASILLNEIYNKEIRPEYTEMLDKINCQYSNFNFLVQRNEGQFEQEGRIHSYRESIAKDQEVNGLLGQHEVSYGVYSHEALDDIVKNAIRTHESLFNRQQDMDLKEQAIGDNGQGERVLVSIESTEDFSDHDIGFYTYQYQDGREGVQYRLVTIGDDGSLIPYPSSDIFFFNRERVQEYIDTHAENLKVIPYDDMVYKSGLKMYEVSLEKELHELDEQRIGEDIKKSGFKPNPELIGNIQKFEQMEGKKYTLKELAELNKQKHGLTGERKECFQKIVAECQNQEQEHGQMQERESVEEMKQQNFLKQQMQMEMDQMAMMQG